MDTSSTPTGRLYATSESSLLGESLVRTTMDFHGSASGASGGDGFRARRRAPRSTRCPRGRPSTRSRAGRLCPRVGDGRARRLRERRSAQGHRLRPRPNRRRAREPERRGPLRLATVRTRGGGAGSARARVRLRLGRAGAGGRSRSGGAAKRRRAEDRARRSLGGRQGGELAAAARPKLATAVVALSPERYLRGRDVLPAARKLRVPTLFAVSTN